MTPLKIMEINKHQKYLNIIISESTRFCNNYDQNTILTFDDVILKYLSYSVYVSTKNKIQHNKRINIKTTIMTTVIANYIDVKEFKNFTIRFNGFSSNER